MKQLHGHQHVLEGHLGCGLGACPAGMSKRLHTVVTELVMNM